MNGSAPGVGRTQAAGRRPRSRRAGPPGRRASARGGRAALRPRLRRRPAAPAATAAAGGRGRRGAVPAAGLAPGSCRTAALFGSQFLLRSVSAASCSARALRHLVDERHRHLGDVQRDAERERQAEQQADDQSDGEAAALCGAAIGHEVLPWSACVGICSGAPTPSTASALRSTWRVAASSASRARVSASSSSTRKRSAA